MRHLITRKGRLPIVLVSTIVLGVASLTLGLRSPGANSPSAAVRTLELSPADLATVGERALAHSLPLSGTLQPLNLSILTAELEGRIVEVRVRAGEAVNAGQVLVRVDKRDLESRLAEHAANLASSRAQLELAEKTYARNADLRERRFISQTSFDNFKGTLDANRAAMNARAAQFALARQALDKATVRSPIDGMVAERLVQPGQHVGVNARLLTVVALEALEFEAQVPATRIGAVRVGQEVQIEAESIPGRFVGRVERINPTADPASRMIPVYVRVANPQRTLRGGMFAQGRLIVEQAPNARVLPANAVRRADDKAYVLKVAGGRIERREVELGIADEQGGWVQIVTGLAPGDTVVIDRLSGLQPGQPVKLPPPGVPGS